MEQDTLRKWLKLWQEDDIPFHKEEIHPSLTSYFLDLKFPQAAKILVPLCGKSRDMKYLADRGYQVIGVEISDIAAKSFFKEHHLDFSRHEEHNFTVYKHRNISIYRGDFFNLSQI